MVWPAASARLGRLIETPEAAPVTTTWKASNSFLAEASLAAAVAPAGAWTLGRIFCEAGATQTVAADADPAIAATARAANVGSVFKQCLLGWLLPGTGGAFRSGSPTEGACRFFHGHCAAPCAELRVYEAIGVLCGRCPTRRHFRRRLPHTGPNGLKWRSVDDFPLYGRGCGRRVGMRPDRQPMRRLPAGRQEASSCRAPPRAAEGISPRLLLAKERSRGSARRAGDA